MEQIKKPRVLKGKTKSQKLVSEDDILHLFFALIKLIKKNAVYEANCLVQDQIQQLKNKIRSLQAELDSMIIKD